MADALLWNEIGNVYLKLGAHADAIAAYSKAVELQPESGWFLCNLGHAFVQMGEHGRALLLFRKSLQFMEDTASQAVVWNRIGDVCRLLKDTENAIQAYHRADDLDLGASLTGRAAASTFDWPVSLRQLIAWKAPSPSPGERPPVVPPPAAEEVPAAPPPQQQPAPALEEPAAPQALPSSGGPGENAPAATVEETSGPALPPAPVPDSRSREKTLVIFPDPNGISPADDLDQTQKTPARPSRGSSSAPQANAAGENLEEILAKVTIYENITRVSKTNDRAWDTLGRLYKSLGRYRDAIEAYQKAIAIAPAQEIYYYYLGLLYSVEQMHPQAVEAFQVVLEKNPDYILAHSALAGVYHRMGLENKANHHIAIALPRMNSENAYNRACFYVICGDFELAIEFLRLALRNKDTTLDWIRSDPDLDPIRSDPRFLELVSSEVQPSGAKGGSNYFASELEGERNRLLPVLNNSLAR